MPDSQIFVGSTRSEPVLDKVKVLKIFGGYNRLVYLGKVVRTGDRKVIKSLKIENINADLINLDTVSELGKRVNDFHGRLNSIGVPVVKNIDIVTRTIAGSRTPIIIQIEDYAGPTGTDVIKNMSNRKVMEVIEAIFKQLVVPLFKNAISPAVPLMLVQGIDGVIRNVTIRKKKGQYKITYIDLFPPKIDGYLEFPEPKDKEVIELGKFRHYYQPGIIINFWISVCLVRPDLVRACYFKLEGLLREFEYRNVEDGINDFISINNNSYPGLEIGKQSSDDINQIISNMGFENIFHLRALAITLGYYRPASRKLLPELMQASHFQHLPLPTSSMKRVKNIITEMAKCSVDQKIAAQDRFKPVYNEEL